MNSLRNSLLLLLSVSACGPVGDPEVEAAVDRGLARWGAAAGVQPAEQAFLAYRSPSPLYCGDEVQGLAWGCAEDGVVEVSDDVLDGQLEQVVTHLLGHLLAGQPVHSAGAGLMNGLAPQRVITSADLTWLCRSAPCSKFQPE